MGDRLVDIGLSADCTSIVAVTVEFATFLDPDKDDDSERIVAPDKLEVGWSGLPDGSRVDFDRVWRAAAETVTDRLGAPAVVDMHGAHWYHAIWRVGDALIALMQGEQMDTYGFWTSRAVDRVAPGSRASPHRPRAARHHVGDRSRSRADDGHVRPGVSDQQPARSFPGGLSPDEQ